MQAPAAVPGVGGEGVWGAWGIWGGGGANPGTRLGKVREQRPLVGNGSKRGPMGPSHPASCLVKQTQVQCVQHNFILSAAVHFQAPLSPSGLSHSHRQGPPSPSPEWGSPTPSSRPGGADTPRSRDRDRPASGGSPAEWVGSRASQSRAGATRAPCHSNRDYGGLGPLSDPNSGCWGSPLSAHQAQGTGEALLPHGG